jgi:hypothetical protein
MQPRDEFSRFIISQRLKFRNIPELVSRLNPLFIPLAILRITGTCATRAPVSKPARLPTWGYGAHWGPSSPGATAVGLLDRRNRAVSGVRPEPSGRHYVWHDCPRNLAILHPSTAESAEGKIRESGFAFGSKLADGSAALEKAAPAQRTGQIASISAWHLPLRLCDFGGASDPSSKSRARGISAQKMVH